jgi:DnaK suppressor protein
MKRAELRHFQTLLHGMLDRTEDTLRSLDEIAVENAPDSLDRIQHATEREMAIRRIELDFSKVQSMRLALQRITEGTYGICFRCDGEIPAKRLNALPWASYCLECQNSADDQKSEHGDMQFARASGD